MYALMLLFNGYSSMCYNCMTNSMLFNNAKCLGASHNFHDV